MIKEAQRIDKSLCINNHGNYQPCKYACNLKLPSHIQGISQPIA